MAPPTGDLFVTNQVATSEFVLRVDPGTGQRNRFAFNAAGVSPDFGSPFGITFEPGGAQHLQEGGDGDAILVADPTGCGLASGCVIRMDAANGQVRADASPPAAGGPTLTSPVDVAVEADGDILVLDVSGHTGNQGGIVRVDPDTGHRTLVSDNSFAGVSQFVTPFSIAVEDDGNILVADGTACGGLGCVMRVDPSTGFHTTTYTSSLWGNPTGLPVDGTGIYVTNASDGALGPGRVVKVLSSGGTSSVVSENSAPAGVPNFAYPSDVAIGGSGDLYVVDFIAFYDPADPGIGGIISVNPTTGDRTRVSRNTNPTCCINFVYPWGIAIAPVRLVFAAVPSIRPLAVAPRARAAARKGSALDYTLGDAARVEFTIYRRLPGRARGLACRPQRSANRGGRACVVYQRVGAFSHEGKKGRNRKAFSGRVGHKALEPGAYRVVARATDRHGNRSLPRSREFKVLRD